MRPRPQEPLSLRQPGSAYGVLLRERDLGFENRTTVNKKVTAVASHIATKQPGPRLKGTTQRQRTLAVAGADPEGGGAIYLDGQY
jgi:hypothetical protein